MSSFAFKGFNGTAKQSLIVSEKVESSGGRCVELIRAKKYFGNVDRAILPKGRIYLPRLKEKWTAMGFSVIYSLLQCHRLY